MNFTHWVLNYLSYRGVIDRLVRELFKYDWFLALFFGAGIQENRVVWYNSKHFGRQPGYILRNKLPHYDPGFQYMVYSKVCRPSVWEYHKARMIKSGEAWPKYIEYYLEMQATILAVENMAVPTAFVGVKVDSDGTLNFEKIKFSPNIKPNGTTRLT